MPQGLPAAPAEAAGPLLEGAFSDKEILQDEEAAPNRKAAEDFGTGAIAGAITQATDRLFTPIKSLSDGAADRLKKEVECWSADPLAHARRRVTEAVEIAEQVAERVAAKAPVLASESQRLLAEDSELLRESSLLYNSGSEEEEQLSFWQKYGTREEVNAVVPKC